MTHAQLLALMVVRRSMGDLGQYVTLTGTAWNRLEACIPLHNRDVTVMRDGTKRSLTCMTCNGPTYVENLQTLTKQDGVL